MEILKASTGHAGEGLFKIKTKKQKMIRQSFIFLERIGLQKEISIWRQGITHWEDFLRQERIAGISKKSKHHYDRCLHAAGKSLLAGDSSFFCSMPEAWRLYSHFRDECVFLDIETTGVSRADSVTMVGLYDGQDAKVMIRGINLDIRSLAEELSHYKLIVTFNGASFDIPFLKRRYPGLIPKIPHIDLRPLCSRVGLSGGLKQAERMLGIRRNPIVETMYGGDVLRLWKMYRASGDDHYLKLLVEYNEEDAMNLQRLADHVVSKLTARIHDEARICKNTNITI